MKGKLQIHFEQVIWLFLLSQSKGEITYARLKSLVTIWNSYFPQLVSAGLRLRQLLTGLL